MDSIEDCKLKKSIVKYPAYLILHIQRMSSESKIKIQRAINYPEEILKNGMNCRRPQYNLESVICHSGEVDFGHYTAYSKRRIKWYYFDDDQVIKANKSEVLNHKNAYILIYSALKD